MGHDPCRQCMTSLSYRLEDVRDVYPNFVLSLLSKLLIDGDNAPLYQSLIESGYALDWIAPVCGMEQGARTTSFHVGVQGVRLEDLDQFSDRVKDILADVVRNGIPEARIDAVLHQYELAVRHESAQFGLNLILGLSHAVNHEVNLEEALRIQALIDRFNKDRESSPNLLIDMIQKYLL
ncbi:Eupitrilysin (M16 family), partial [Fasciolopsis buskii]